MNPSWSTQDKSSIHVMACHDIVIVMTIIINDNANPKNQIMQMHTLQYTGPAISYSYSMVPQPLWKSYL